MFDQLTVRKQLKADGILRRQSLRHADLASDANAVDAIIQALDDNSLIPAAAKGTEGAGSYASAKELARSLADMLAAANRKKQYSVELTLPISYRHVDDLRDIFDRTEAIVRQIAGAIPGGVPNVGEVTITPARTGKDDTFPARRIVNYAVANRTPRSRSRNLYSTGPVIHASGSADSSFTKK